MMFCSIVCLGQQTNEYVSVNRDSLFNVLLNVSELKVDNAHLKKKISNQKLIINSQSIIIGSTDIKVSVLTKQINANKKVGRKKIFNSFGKGFISGGLLVLILSL